MTNHLKLELENFPNILNSVKKTSEQFLDSLDLRPTSSTPYNHDNSTLPDSGHGTESTLELFLNQFDTHLVASTGPRYWGFVTGGATPAAIAGDWLASIYDQNTQTTEGQGDISAIIEFETIKLLLQLFQLPERYLGGFVSGATMANFTGLAVARQWAGHQQGIDIAKKGIKNTIPILTANAHSSSVKCLSMLGLGSSNIINVNTKKGNREAISNSHLEEQLKKLTGSPAILISSAGTVNTVDFDDFKAITKLRSKYKFWWHIDAAFGAFAACSEKYKKLLEGWENADSITIDCHKWLNVPYENGFFLIQDKHRNLQVETFQNSNAPYLGDPLDNFNYLNFLPENSRRLKALPVWFSLKAYGHQGFRDIVNNCIKLAQKFGNMIDNSSYFELLAPVHLNNLCFTLNNKDQYASKFLEAVNETGKVFMTPTTYNGKNGLRASFVNWRTNESDIELAFYVMNKEYKKLFVNN